MKKVYLSIKVLVFTVAIALISNFANAQFTQGNVALFVAASNTANNTTGSIVEINTTNAGQSALNTFAIPSGTVTLSNQLRFSGSATSTGYLANSHDGSLLSFSGSNTINSADAPGIYLLHAQLPDGSKQQFKLIKE